MPITTYDPDDQYTAGNTTINIMPAVAAAALDKATIAEWDAGTTIQEATEEFSIGTDASTISRKKIGDTVATQKPGARTYNISDTVLVASSPQAANTLIEGLTIDAIKYIGVRPGLSDTTAAAAAQKVWLVKVQVLACDPEPITTEDGNAYQWRVKWLVLGRNLAATITAS